MPFDTEPVPSVVCGLVLVSLNCTVPVTVFGEIVAVNVTELPNVDGFCDDVIVIEAELLDIVAVPVTVEELPPAS